jgi:hypothetical protein
VLVAKSCNLKKITLMMSGKQILGELKVFWYVTSIQLDTFNNIKLILKTSKVCEWCAKISVVASCIYDLFSSILIYYGFVTMYLANGAQEELNHVFFNFMHDSYL